MCIRDSNVSLRESRPLNGSSRNPYLVECLLCHFVELNGCTLDANNVTYDSVYARASHVFLYNTGLYNACLLYTSRGKTGGHGRGRLLSVGGWRTL